MGAILIGTASWTDKSLIDSGLFYPSTAKSAEDRLKYYASQFPIVEIDSSYYGIPTPETAQLWVGRTPANFVFNIKAYRLFTRHQTPIITFPKELRAALGPWDKKNIYDRDVPAEIKLELWRQFRSVLEVLRGGSKLGAVHFQFAPWVAFHPESFDYIEHCRAMLAGFDLAIEFRNGTWFDTDAHAARTLAFERDQGLVNVVVDELGGIKSTIPAVWEVTQSKLSIVRLHGRNHGTWNKKGLSASSDRFNYDYNHAELAEIGEDVKRLSHQAKAVHVLFNVNHQNQGQRAAKMMQELLNSGPDRDVTLTEREPGSDDE